MDGKNKSLTLDESKRLLFATSRILMRIYAAVAYSYGISSPHGHHAGSECRFLRMLASDVEIIVTSFVFVSCGLRNV
jgi:hypothetical protein